jgi:hypothetical protein
VVDFLKVPGIGAGLGVHCEDRGAEQIVAFAHRAVVIRPAIAYGEVDQAELRVERRRVPDRCPAARIMVGAGRPAVAARLAWPRQCVGAPQDLAGLGVHSPLEGTGCELLVPATSQRKRAQLIVAVKSSRNRWFADSPMEGDGFELLVPRHKAVDFRSISRIAGVSAGLLNDTT